MAQVGNPATHNEKEVKTIYPVDKGLTAGTQTQEGRESVLIAEENSLVAERLKVGLY
jgi:hypothetical protein